MFVKPAPDRLVRRPDTRVYLLAEGEDVPADTFWTKRLLDGDVVKAEPPVGSPEPAALPSDVEEAEAPPAPEVEPEPQPESKESRS